MSNPKPTARSLQHTLLGFFFAHWHLRRIPNHTPEDRQRRGLWCRDHCSTFAGRWFIVAIAGWLIQFSPLGIVFLVGGWPVLAILALLAFILGIMHLVMQIVAQKRVGPPPIDPPEDHDD